MNADYRMTSAMLSRMGKTQARAVMDACGLTEEEKRKALAVYVEGRSLDIVADELGMSSRTLGRHLQVVLQKLTSFF